MVRLNINGKDIEIDTDPTTPLLWVLRDLLDMTGTKYGCGQALCGACTVHLEGRAVRSCITSVAAAEGQKVVTIENIGTDPVGHIVQEAWIAHDVPQCGYCQSGQVMSAVALLKTTPKPDDTEIQRAMGGNICRCGTYVRINNAIKDAATRLS